MINKFNFQGGYKWTHEQMDEKMDSYITPWVELLYFHTHKKKTDTFALHVGHDYINSMTFFISTVKHWEIYILFSISNLDWFLQWNTYCSCL